MLLAVIEKLFFAMPLTSRSRPRLSSPVHGNKLLTRTEIESLFVAFFFVSRAVQEINWNHDLFLAQYFLIKACTFKMFIAAKTRDLTNFMLLQVFN